jgi:ketosteroid isomerase-like protein
LKVRGGWTIDNLAFARVGDDKVIGTAQLRSEDGKLRQRNPVVITFRDGRIVDMQGCASRLEAEQFARRH